MTRVRRTDSLGTLSEIQDRDASVSVRVDPDTGFLHADSVPITRAGVFRYADEAGNVWGELRDESEIMHPDSVGSFDPSTITNDHPIEFLSLENWKGDSVGIVGKVRRDGRFIRADLVITDKETIDAIQAGKREISCGYWAETVPATGIRDGIPYSRKQLRPKGNHVAIVDRGRAGPECRIDREGYMKTKKTVIDGIEIELPAETVDALEEARKTKTKTIKIGDRDFVVPLEVADAWPNPEDEDDEKSDSTPAPAPAPDKSTAKADALENEFRSYRDAEEKRIDERVRVVTLGREYLGQGTKFDGVSNSAIRRKILAKIADGVDLSGKSDDYVSAYLDAVIEARAQAIADSNEIVISGAKPTQDEIGEVIKFRDDYSNKRKIGA